VVNSNEYLGILYNVAIGICRPCVESLFLFLIQAWTVPRKQFFDDKPEWKRRVTPPLIIPSKVNCPLVVAMITQLVHNEN